MKISPILFYVPNLIGYFRIALLLVCYYLYPRYYSIGLTAYVISQLLDFVDGHSARMFNQCTSFGQSLDMLTDRISTLILVFLFVREAEPTSLYRRLFTGYMIFQIVIDLCSHWLQVSNANLSGTHHKTFKNNFKTLDLYYKKKSFMFILCFGNEGFHVTVLVLLQLKEWCIIFYPLLAVFSILSFIKLYIHILQLISNLQKALTKDELDVAERQKNK